MAGTINYLYDLNQNVYVIDTCDDNTAELVVLAGTVTRIRAEVLDTTDSILYDVGFSGGETKVFEEADVFPDKATALTEYGLRIP